MERTPSLHSVHGENSLAVLLNDGLRELPRDPPHGENSLATPYEGDSLAEVGLARGSAGARASGELSIHSQLSIDAPISIDVVETK
jgi:hypothetical protein